jgi:glutathione peroxidase
MLPNIVLRRIDGSQENLQNYDGKVLLVVNVASHCGFTGQYKELESLYQKLNPEGFEIMAFPCNQFGNQEPGTSAQIQSFCEKNYAISFPLFEKIEVNGSNTHPLYEYLKKAAPGILGTTSIKWNFTKFLVSRSGKPTKRYDSITQPGAIMSDAKLLLNELT